MNTLHKQYAVSVVTGGMRGIGRSIAAALIQRGDIVWIFDNAPQTTVTPPDGCEYRSVDVADYTAVGNGIEEIIRAHKRIDVLVNNAGIVADGLAIRMSVDAWKKVVDVNMNGSFWCSQAVLKYMVRQRKGYIVNISSIVGSTGNPGQVNYAASKAGVNAMTKTLAREYGTRGILVNAIAPGFIATEMTRQLSADVQNAAIACTSVKRAGSPEDIAACVAYLTSGLADYITGQIIHIDGGMW